MEVLKAELIEVESLITRRKEETPYTFFSLDDSEQTKYASFRAKHDGLKAMPRGRNPKREDGETELEKMFLELVNPYFKRQGLEAIGCFTTYGEDRITMLRMPNYVLFENGQPFDSVLEFNYWFSTQDENLSCKSFFSYIPGYSASKYESPVLYDLIRKMIEGKTQDGINFPIISFRGRFVQFASTGFAVPSMAWIMDILKKLGPESMKELTILREAYVDESSKEYSYSELKEKVFREAYENKLKLEIELMRAGFITKVT